MKPDAATQRRVLDWFASHARLFPWRATRDPYATMIAEVMLQQTQTGRVGPIYESFLRRFPTVQRLAHAPAMEVIQAWKGLGYNRRAVDLHRATQMIERDFFGEIPNDPDVLRALPGIGEYSANAIACFAHDRQVAVVDVNVRRVLSRAANGTNGDAAGAASIRALAERWLPDGHAYQWNQALMDIGAMFCRIDKPLCTQCPFARGCAYKKAGKHRAPAARAAKPKERFEGSRRQKRGAVVDHLRRAARKGITLGDLAAKIHPGDAAPDLDALVDVLTALESEGLAVLTPGARKGSSRGVVRLPN